MISRRTLLSAALALLVAGSATAQTANRPTPGFVRVRLDTSMGAITVALDARRAPKTTANFLAYVDDGRFDDTSFYRAARRKTDPKLGFVQGGIRTNARRMLPTFPHEPTSRTGIRHTDGTISMARVGNGSAGGNFFITVGAMPSMDAGPRYAGYAAFGHVVAGMDVVRRILAERTGGGSDAMKGQMIYRDIRIVRAKRLDGTPKPTGQPKTWLWGLGR